MVRFTLVALVDEHRRVLVQGAGVDGVSLDCRLPTLEQVPVESLALVQLAMIDAFDPDQGWFTYAVMGAHLGDTLPEAIPVPAESTWCRPQDLSALDLSPWTARVLPELATFAGVQQPVGQQRFAAAVLVDPQGRLLLQERDEFPAIDPETWGLCGGHVEPGESFEAAAYRELAEETGVRAEPGSLTLWGEFVVDHRTAHGRWDLLQTFTAATTLSDTDIECHEGRQITFVEPAVALKLPLSHSAAQAVPAFLTSPAYRSLSMMSSTP